MVAGGSCSTFQMSVTYLGSSIPNSGGRSSTAWPVMRALRFKPLRWEPIAVRRGIGDFLTPNSFARPRTPDQSRLP